MYGDIGTNIAVVEWLVLDLFGNRFVSTKNLYTIQQVIADWLDEGLVDEDIEVVPCGATMTWSVIPKIDPESIEIG